MFFGISIAEFSLSELPDRLSRVSPLLTPILTFAGLLFMSQPSDHAFEAPWSAHLESWGSKMYPGDIARSWGSVGSIVLVVGIIISPHARRLLSRPPLIWLGKVSFPIYLLHGTFMRSMLAWFTFAGQAPQPFNIAQPVDDVEVEPIYIYRYPQPGSIRILFSIVVSMSAMLVASHYWAKNVEPVFGQITKRAEEMMFGKAEGGSARPIHKEQMA